MSALSAGRRGRRIVLIFASLRAGHRLRSRRRRGRLRTVGADVGPGVLTALAAGRPRFFRGELMGGPPLVSGLATFAAGCPRFLGREAVRGSLGVGRLASLACYLPLLLGVH